jgi:hypothetical protein
MTIKYEIKRAYGHERYYILDPKFQKNYALLTGLSTMTKESMKLLEEMGFKFEEKKGGEKR